MTSLENLIKQYKDGEADWAIIKSQLHSDEYRYTFENCKKCSNYVIYKKR